VNDVVQDAAQVLVPLLSAGAGAAAHDLAEQAGADLSAGAVRIVERIRHRLSGGQPGATEVVDALQAALTDGDVTEAELQTLVNRAGRDNVSMRAKTIINGGVVVHGDFNG
jgi:hypothetical protein